MNFIRQELNDVWVIEPKIFGDNRGYFTETYRKDLFDKFIGNINFIQDNESKSSYGVFRGLHYQKGEFSQAKLVRVTSGSVLDIIVDLRKSSSTFGKHICVELSEDNHRQLFVPRGFAHGFLVLSQTAIFNYKVDNIYCPSAECSLNFKDKFIKLHLPIDEKDLNLSEKDLMGKMFDEIETFE
ncbi:MAG: dTDP-4-dehydrorhamnose 3,5-epimerase [Bacteroidales bacterium]|nr:dTDP-4-dehydrorhamnose 3,5-epimerase [Bacteroidales bacterium]